MLSNKLKKEIALYCYATVSGMFADFLNPVNRGTKFTWQKFPKMVADLCHTMVHVNIVYKPHMAEDVKLYTFTTATDIATRLVERSDIINQSGEELGNVDNKSI